MLMFICRPIVNIISYVIHMRTSTLQMASNLLAIDENSLELLILLVLYGSILDFPVVMKGW